MSIAISHNLALTIRADCNRNNFRREVVPNSKAAQEATRRAYETVESAAKLANETKKALENQISDIKEFLENENANPETIQAVVDEVLAISIPFDENKIRELSEEARHPSFI